MMETDELHPLPQATLHSSVPPTAEFKSTKTEERVILLGTDNSLNSEYAFQWLLSNVFKQGDHLLVVSILPVAEALDVFSFGSEYAQELKKVTLEQTTAI